MTDTRAADIYEAINTERERDRYWQALTDIAGYEGWQTPGVPAAKAMGDIARKALSPEYVNAPGDRPSVMECQTPGAVFHIHIRPRSLHVNVTFGRPLSLTEDEAEALDNGIHDALEAALAPYFRPSVMGRG